MWAISLKTLQPPKILIIPSFSFYVCFGIVLALLARKTRTDKPWRGWVQVDNLLLLCRLDYRPSWLILLFMISFSNRRRYCAYRSCCPEEIWHADLDSALLPLGQRGEALAEAQQATRLGFKDPWDYWELGITPCYLLCGRTAVAS